MKTKCMSCKSSMKKMAVGGTTTKRIIKKSTGGMYGIPQENMGTSGQYGFAKKGGSTGTHKMPNGKTMLNSKMQNGGGTRPMAPIAPTVRPMRNDPKKCIGSPPGYVWNERLGGCIAPARSPSPSRVPAKSMMKKGGATKATKFAALAPPYDKATFADKIVGAKKSAGSKKLPKAQLGAIVKGVVKYGSKGIKIGARAAQKNKALTMQAKRLSNLEKVAPGSKRKLMDKVLLNKVTNSERKQIANLFDRVSKVERTRAFNKDLKRVGLVGGGVMGSLGLTAKYLSDKSKYISDKTKNINGVDKKKKKK